MPSGFPGRVARLSWISLLNSARASTLQSRSIPRQLLYDLLSISEFSSAVSLFCLSVLGSFSTFGLDLRVQSAAAGETIASSSATGSRADLRTSSAGLASARESLCRGLGSRWFTERFHRNALVTHFQHGQVFCAARRLENYAVARCRFHQCTPQR